MTKIGLHMGFLVWVSTLVSVVYAVQYQPVSGSSYLVIADFGSSVTVTIAPYGSSDSSDPSESSRQASVSFVVKRDVLMNAKPEAIACAAENCSDLSAYPALANAVDMAQSQLGELGQRIDDRELVNFIALFGN